MRDLSKILIIVALAALLAACGVRSAYNNLDWLVMRWVDNQVSLNTDQERAVRQALDDHLQWHCTSQLPEYVEFLRRVDADVDAGRISIERFNEHGEQLAEFGRSLVNEARPAIIELLASLDDAQTRDLLDGFEQRNEELIEEISEISQAERQRNQVRGMERGMRRFIGRLTPDQRERLEQWAGDLEPSGELTLKQRLNWQSSFAQTLSKRHDYDRFEAGMNGLLSPGSTWSDDYRELMVYNRERTVEALVDLHHMATPRQINRLQSRLNSLAGDFARLSCG
jgi:hypothetical protein